MGGVLELSDTPVDTYCITVPIKRVLLKQFTDHFDTSDSYKPVRYEDVIGFNKFHSEGVKSYTHLHKWMLLIVT